ncbi:TonB-dependent receptor [Parahaliea sp. F7430]|uniref:TonB-dependent receptor n=1 Tax=Sediminihaliea albiluteola TaxID=2758564 RepID=A0A7W2YIA5_9GAMM|nr:TonB-dependent receptor [Sediminihaliea albiluteola]MBA6411832.1 TonB-dependent receptor [Sediminihaliea albiluteola]
MLGRWLAPFACLLCLVFSEPMQAVEPAAPARQITLPAQALSESLLALSAVFERPVFFASALTEGLQAPALNGRQSLSEALTLLLKDLPLSFHFAPSGAVVLSAKALPSATSEALVARPKEEVLVTGSHIPRGGSQKSLPLQLIRLDRSDMEFSGAAQLSELLAQLPSTAGNQIQVHNLNQPLTAGATSFNLRNLGLGAALVLLDGKRPARAAVATTEGETFVDVGNLVPAIALERIDVVHGGVSAVYGSDAVAGVVNLQTREHFQGLELSVRHQATDTQDQSDSQLSALAGKWWREGQLRWLSALSYLDRSDLPTADREFAQQTAFSSSGYPGTFVSDGQVLADPACGVGNSFLDPETGFCQLDISGYFDLTPKEQRWQLWTRLENIPSATQQASLTLAYNRADVAVRASPSFPFARHIPEVPAHNPGNPFSKPALFYGRILGVDSAASQTDSSYEHAFISAEIERHMPLLSIRASITHSRNDVDYERRDTLLPQLEAALAGRGGSNAEQYWSPLYGSDNDPALLQSLLADWGMRGRSTLTVAEMLASTDWYSNPLGQHAVALGFQVRRESLRHSFGQAFNDGHFLTLGGGPDFGGSQRVSAMFAEWHQRFSPALTMELALRHEDYDGRLGVLSPGLTLHWRPTAPLALRAAWSRSFAAPTLFQRVAQQSFSTAVIDPQTVNTPIFVNSVAEGSRDLDAAVADAWSTGLSLGEGSATRLDLDIWHYAIDDLIFKEPAQRIVDAALRGDPAAQARVDRDPLTGQIERVTTAFVNGASLRTWGLDAQLQRRLLLKGFELSSSARFNWVGGYSVKDQARNSQRQALGYLNSTLPGVSAMPRWRAQLHLDWSTGSQRGRLQLNHVSSYLDEGNDNKHIASNTTLDAHYRWTREGWTLGAGVLNLTDRDPPSVQSFLGYDSRTHDPRGRLWYVELNWRI